MGSNPDMNQKLKLLLELAKEIGLILLRPNHARKRIANLTKDREEISKSLDTVTDESLHLQRRYEDLEKENKDFREQIYQLKAWIRTAHRLDKPTVANTIKAALAGVIAKQHEKT